MLCVGLSVSRLIKLRAVGGLGRSGGGKAKGVHQGRRSPEKGMRNTSEGHAGGICGGLVERTST